MILKILDIFKTQSIAYSMSSIYSSTRSYRGNVVVSLPAHSMGLWGKRNVADEDTRYSRVTTTSFLIFAEASMFVSRHLYRIGKAQLKPPN